jgi:hypothetical protein
VTWTSTTSQDVTRRPALSLRPGPPTYDRDNPPVHRAKAGDRFVASICGALGLHRLPAYSLQLNPDEWVCKNLKHDGVAPDAPGPRLLRRPGIGLHHRRRLMSASVQSRWYLLRRGGGAAVPEA